LNEGTDGLYKRFESGKDIGKFDGWTGSCRTGYQTMECQGSVKMENGQAAVLGKHDEFSSQGGPQKRNGYFGREFQSGNGYQSMETQSGIGYTVLNNGEMDGYQSMETQSTTDYYIRNYGEMNRYTSMNTQELEGYSITEHGKLNGYTST
jgi:hypothetical protein